MVIVPFDSRINVHNIHKMQARKCSNQQPSEYCVTIVRFETDTF